jgi:hypothetical protein
VDAHHEQLRYHLSKSMADGSAELILTALELLERLSAFIPSPRIHRHRYFGVLVPNAPLRPAVTALASERAEADSDPAKPSPACNRAEGATSEPSPSDEKPRRAAVSLWAMLLARIFELFPLVCPRCGGEMEIISFITEAPTVRAILTCPSASRAKPRRSLLAAARRSGKCSTKWPNSIRSIPNRSMTSTRA